METMEFLFGKVMIFYSANWGNKFILYCTNIFLLPILAWNLHWETESTNFHKVPSEISLFPLPPPTSPSLQDVDGMQEQDKLNNMSWPGRRKSWDGSCSDSFSISSSFLSTPSSSRNDIPWGQSTNTQSISMALSWTRSSSVWRSESSICSSSELLTISRATGETMDTEVAI